MVRSGTALATVSQFGELGEKHPSIQRQPHACQHPSARPEIIGGQSTLRLPVFHLRVGVPTDGVTYPAESVGAGGLQGFQHGLNSVSQLQVGVTDDGGGGPGGAVKTAGAGRRQTLDELYFTDRAQLLRSVRAVHPSCLNEHSGPDGVAAGAGPGDAPLTIDLDSTICETYGLAKEGARHHGYTGKRGYHPLLAIAAGTGDVLMSRLRQGRANTARGAAHFLRETVGRVRYGGASGQLTVRADSGFYTHALVAVCREMGVRFSITIRQHKGLRELIEAIPEQDWTPIPYWMDGAADVAETTYTPFQSEADAAPVRLIVRRVKPTPGSQLALFATYSYHGFITDRDGEMLELEADHRRHAEIENAIRDLKYGVGLNHMPSGRFAANGAWLAVQVMAHNLARWTARIGLGERIATTKTLRRRFFALVGRITRSARRLTLHLPQHWPWETQFTRAMARLRAIPLPA